MRCLPSPTQGIQPNGLQQVLRQGGQMIGSQGLQAVYAQQASPYGLAYAYPQDFGGHMPAGAMLQPDGTIVYQANDSMLHQMSGLPHGMAPTATMAGTAKLMQAAGGKPLQRTSGDTGVNWSNGNGKADNGTTSANGQEVLTAAGGPAGTGNLVQVMDADGQVYYYNPNEN